MQTTLSVSDAAVIETILRQRLPNLLGPPREDICYATTNRQRAVEALAPKCDAFVILGGFASSNSRRLVEIAEAAGCPRARLVERPEELPLAWVEGLHVLGVGCGASTPEAAVDALIRRLADAFEVALGETGFVEEGVRFGLPVFPRTGVTAQASDGGT